MTLNLESMQDLKSADKCSNQPHFYENSLRRWLASKLVHIDTRLSALERSAPVKLSTQYSVALCLWCHRCAWRYLLDSQFYNIPRRLFTCTPCISPCRHLRQQNYALHLGRTGPSDKQGHCRKAFPHKWRVVRMWLNCENATNRKRKRSWINSI